MMAGRYPMLRSSRPKQVGCDPPQYRQRRNHDRKEREARDGLNHACDAEDNKPEPASTGDPDAERHAEREPDPQRDERELEMCL